MDLNIDTSSLLYGIGAVIGIISIIYFYQSNLFQLSPVTDTVLPLIAFAFFLLFANYKEDYKLSWGLYILAAVFYGMFVWSGGRFFWQDQLLFAVLAVSSLLFIGLGVLKQRGSLDLPQAKTRYLMFALLLAIPLLLAFDVMGTQPSYQLKLKDSVQIGEGDFRVGQIVVSNDFPWSRKLEPKDYRACLYLPDWRANRTGRKGERSDLDIDRVFTPYEPHKIAGDSTLGLNLTARFYFDREEVKELPQGEIPIFMADECPESSEKRQIVVAERKGYPYYP